VHYIIEGSARKFGQVLHLNVQLIAAPDNTRLWGDRFEQDMTDIGAGIDAMVRKVSAVLDIQILDAEIARRARARPGQPDAYDYVIRSWAAWDRPLTPRLQVEVTAWLEEALRLDPSLVPAMQSLASWLTYRFDGFVDSPDWGDRTLIERAGDLLAAGLQIDPNNNELLLSEARMLRRPAVEPRRQPPVGVCSNSTQMSATPTVNLAVTGWPSAGLRRRSDYSRR
jgi:hypothetical protein